MDAKATLDRSQASQLAVVGMFSSATSSNVHHNIFLHAEQQFKQYLRGEIACQVCKVSIRCLLASYPHMRGDNQQRASQFLQALSDYSEYTNLVAQVTDKTSVHGIKASEV